MMPDWLIALAVQGTPREVAGNSPLWLDDPDSVWLIRNGRLDVFAVPRLPGGLLGARRHLFRSSIGGLLCGVAALDPTRPRLLAVGGPGSEVVHLSREQAASLGGLELAALLNGWIRSLTDGVALR